MICLLVAALAANAGELRDAHVYEAGTVVEDVQAATDGHTVAFVESGSDTLWVVRSDTWKATPTQPCSGIVGLGAYPKGFAVGCGDGSIALVDTSTRKPAPTPVIVSNVAVTPILGVTADSTNIYVIAENKDAGSNPVILAIDIASRAPAKGAWPATLGFSGYLDAETTQDQYVIVSHGGDNVSKVYVPTASVATNASSIGYTDCKDVDTDALAILLACQIGILKFNPTTNDVSLVLGSTKDWFHVESVWIDEQEDLVWFFDALDGMFVYDYDSSTGTVTDDLVAAVPDPHDSSELSGLPGYAFLGSDNGTVHVYTHLPWVDVTPIDDVALNGQVLDVTFTSDIEGDYQVMFGKTVLGKGHVIPGKPVTVPVTVDDSFVEGDNVIIVSVIDQNGDQGHGGVSVAVNNPPSQVVLQDGDVGWGDATLYLTFAGIPDEDLKLYRVYWSPKKFEPGPGTPPAAQEQDFTAAPGDPMSIVLEGLENEVTYYVAVRAVDQTDLEGAMSVVLSGTPHETFSASELAGDAGGYGCASTRSRAPIALSILVGLAVLGRRGTVAALALLVLGGTARAQDTSDDTTGSSGTTETTSTSTTGTSTTDATTPTPPPATPPPAAPPPPTPPPAATTTVVTEPGAVKVVHADEEEEKFTAAMEARFGPLWFDGKNPLNDVYGNNGNNLLMVEGGATFRDILELDFGVGRYHRRGNLVAEDGSQSNDESVITTFPLTLSAKLRLDFLDEQWIVPVVSAGGDYWLWNEKAGYDSTAMQWDAKQSGGHYGYHYAGGIQILLDVFEPRRASLLHARSGVNDSYLVVEYRQREVGEQEDGLKFSGGEVTVGVRVGF